MYVDSCELIYLDSVSGLRRRLQWRFSIGPTLLKSVIAESQIALRVDKMDLIKTLLSFLPMRRPPPIFFTPFVELWLIVTRYNGSKSWEMPVNGSRTG
jgi:hypothetical protein